MTSRPESRGIGGASPRAILRTAAITLARRLHSPIYAWRVRRLVHYLAPYLSEGDRILDVGCGSGALGHALERGERSPRGVRVTGLERHPRAGCVIPVATYDGGRFPFRDRAFDAVIVADVLHHERDPDHLLRECGRVTKRLLVVKDHQRSGPLAQARIALLDWAANLPYGVPCLYRYHTPEGWRRWLRSHGLADVRERRSLRLYPPIVDALFGGRLQYLAVLRRPPDHRFASGDPC